MSIHDVLAQFNVVEPAYLPTLRKWKSGEYSFADALAELFKLGCAIPVAAAMLKMK